jgi:molybdopterin synthase sulfur carrier subunit
MKILYFAWIRERVGKAEEMVDPPASVQTVADLVQWLKGRGEEYAYAFESHKVVRAALDRVHVRPEAKLSGAREIALFPPMTGG